MAFATVLYNEPKASTFRGIKLTVGKEEFLFDTGDPVVDHWDYLQHVGTLSVAYVSCSSSFDHYFMDHPSYKRRRVIEVYFDPKTLEVADTDLMSFGEMDRCLRMWLYKGMETMDDLKDYIRKKKKR